MGFIDWSQAQENQYKLCPFFGFVHFDICSAKKESYSVIACREVQKSQ
jgi:hypothetical protein